MRRHPFSSRSHSPRSRKGVALLTLCYAGPRNRQSSADYADLAGSLGRGVRKLESCIEKLGIQISLVADDVRFGNWQRSLPSFGTETEQNTVYGSVGRGQTHEPAELAADPARASVRPAADAELFLEDPLVKKLAENFAASVRQTASTVASLVGDRPEATTMANPALIGISPPYSSPSLRRFQKQPSPAGSASPRGPASGKWNATVEDENLEDVIDGIQRHLSIHPLAMNARRRSDISNWAQEVPVVQEPPMTPPESHVNWEEATALASEGRPRTPSSHGSQSYYGKTQTSASPFAPITASEGRPRTPSGQGFNNIAQPSPSPFLPIGTTEGRPRTPSGLENQDYNGMAQPSPTPFPRMAAAEGRPKTPSGRENPSYYGMAQPSAPPFSPIATSDHESQSYYGGVQPSATLFPPVAASEGRPRTPNNHERQGYYGRAQPSASPFPLMTTPDMQAQGEMQRLLQTAQMFIMSQEYDKALKPLLLAAHKSQAEPQLDRTSCQRGFEMLGDAIAKTNPFGGGGADEEIRSYPEVIAAVLKSRYELSTRLCNDQLFFAASLVLNVCLRVRSADPNERKPLSGHPGSGDLELAAFEDSRYRPRPGRAPVSDGILLSGRPPRPQSGGFEDAISYQQHLSEPSLQPGRPLTPLPSDGASQYRNAGLRRPSFDAQSSSSGFQRPRPPTMGWKELYCLPLWDQIYVLAARASMRINPVSAVAESALGQLLGMHRENAPISCDVEYLAKHLQAEIQFSSMALDSAKKLASEAVRGRKMFLGSDHLHTQQSTALLVAICRAKDDNEEMFWTDQTSLTYERLVPTTGAQRLERCQWEVHALFGARKAMAVDLAAQFLDAEYELDSSAPDSASLDHVRQALSGGNGNFWASRAQTDEVSGRSSTTWPAITYLMQSSPRKPDAEGSCSTELDFLLRGLKRTGGDAAFALFVAEGGFHSALRRAILQGRVDETRVVCEHSKMGQDDFAVLMGSVLASMVPQYEYPDVESEDEDDLPSFDMDSDDFSELQAQLRALMEVIKANPPWDVGDVVRTLVARHEDSGGGPDGPATGLLDHPAVLDTLLDFADHEEECVNGRLPRTPGGSGWPRRVAAPLLHHAVGYALSRAAGRGRPVAGPLQAVMMLLRRGARVDETDDRGYVAAQVAAEEAHTAEAGGGDDGERLAEDVLWLVWCGADEPEPRLRLHQLYRGSAAGLTRMVTPKRSKLSRLFRSSS